MADVDMSAAASPSLPPSPPLRPPSITLTSTERELFAYLLRVREHARADSVELRVCGGWVRDKLLGRESSDIDIALDSMTGRAFVECINAFERACGRKERVVGVMKARPDQSKAMEVATVPFYGVGKVDFAGMHASLACEKNVDVDASAAESESIQTFGTPLQDAERRDFTINSLFYNLSTQQVEDLTGKGLDDLRDGILRTPQDARLMLLEDPMRTMRAVRFASQLDFQLDASLRAVIELREVREALAAKISRQRLGQVLTTTLAGASAHPGRAVQWLRDLRLLKSVLFPSVPELAVVLQPDGSPAAYAGAASDGGDGDEIWTRSCAYAEQMCVIVAASEAASSTVERSDSEQHMLKLRLLAALLLPFVGHHVEQRDVSMPTYMIRDSLRLSNQDARDVDVGIFRHLHSFRELVYSDVFDYVRVALLLRTIRPHWSLCRDVTLAKELAECSSPPASETRRRITQRFDALTARVVDSGLDDICTRPPLLSGGELVSELRVKPGAAVKQMLDRVFLWQLKHPEGTRHECLAHFRAQV